MESEAHYVRVGTAVLVLVGLLALGLYWLTGGLDRSAGQRYAVHFSKQSLEGLQINSDVRMQGIKVGKVIDYAILPGEMRTVRVVLEVDARTPLRDGVTAVVNRHLVTGLASIDLENGPPGAGLLPQPSGDVPRIAEGVPQLTRVADTLEELGQLGRDTLIRLNAVLSDSNQAELSASLGHLGAASAELRETLVSTRRAADNLSELGAAAQTRLGRLDRLGDEASATLTAARGSLAGLDHELRALSLQLRQTTDLGLQELQTSAASLRQTSERWQEAGRVLADPARVLYGTHPNELGPGERAP